MTTTSFVENAQTIAVRASAIEDDLSLESSTELTGKGRYQLNFDYAFLTNTQAPSAGASPFAEFQLLWDQNQSAPQLPYERSDEIFRISRGDLLANPSLQQAGGCGQGGIGNAVYSLCTGWRNQTVDIPDFYNGQRFVLRLLLQDGGSTFSDTDPVTRLIPDNGYASVLAMDNFKLVGLPVITGSAQTPDGPWRSMRRSRCWSRTTMPIRRPRTRRRSTGLMGLKKPRRRPRPMDQGRSHWVPIRSRQPVFTWSSRS